MKSHQYASKRRLTNICCLIVSLGFIKFIFVAYIMAGGQFFEFTSEKKEMSPKASIIAQQQEQKRINKLSQNNLEQNSQNIVAQNANASGTMENIAPVSNSRVSFLPKSQNNGYPKIQNTKNNSNMLASNVPANTPVNVSSNIPANTPVSAPVNPFVSTQKMRVQKASIGVEPSDIINSEIALAQASSLTANSARAQVRANLLKNAFGHDLAKSSRSLEGMDNQPSNYKNKSTQVQRTQNVQGQNVASNTVNNVANQGSSSFFSFVGTAHAAEEVYIRPDENLNIPIPTPNVSTYTSPDSLEYKQSELNRKEEELISLQQQMSARMKELNELEGRIDTMVQGANELQGDKYKHLIDTYVSMKARKAAEALVTLDEGIAVRILNGMKGKQSGEIFSYMDPIQAARLSSAMTELRM